MITKDEFEKALSIVINYDRQVKEEMSYLESHKLIIIDSNAPIRELIYFIPDDYGIRYCNALLSIDMKTVGEFKNKYNINTIKGLRNAGKKTHTVLSELQERIILKT